MLERSAARKLLLVFALLVIEGVFAAQVSSALSIEVEPVKVTNRNSGPRYDIDRDEDHDPSKLTPVVWRQPGGSDSSGASRPPQESGEESEMPTRHLQIRRIFLVPMMRPARPEWENNDSDQAAREPSERQESSDSSMLARPFWPFLTPARRAHPHHNLLGTDEASRSPTGEHGANSDQDKAASNIGGGEREGAAPGRDQPNGLGLFDPIQMMMDIMHQAITGQLAPVPSIPTDLNKDASSSTNQSASSDEQPKIPDSELAPGARPPVKPTSQNETHEDVVEIEGKKYLRKTVINRHVGENIIFMTKRLIFVPLNETEPTTTTRELPAATTSEPPTVATNSDQSSTTTSSSTTTTTTSTTTALPIEDKSSVSPANEMTTTTTGSPTSSSIVTSSEPSTTITSTTSGAPEATTKAKESWVDRVSDAIDKAAERLVD